jgi:hypothetical protein
MTRQITGWLLLLAMLGWMFGLVSDDLANIGQWAEVPRPQFVAAFLKHLSVLIGTFVAGQTIPTIGKQE